MKKYFFLTLALLAFIYFYFKEVAPAPINTKSGNSLSFDLSESDKTPTGTYKFAVIGDFGDPDSGPVWDVVKMIDSWHVDSIVTTGDNAYPEGSMDSLQNGVKKYFPDYVESCNFFQTLGNHDWGQTNPYTVDTLPSTQFFSHCNNQGNHRYYSVTLGNGLVKLIVLDTDYRDPDSANQGSYLDQFSAGDEPYKFVFLHEPAFSSCDGKNNPRSDLSYKENGITAVFAGHCHLYERLEIDGLTEIINGAGGGGQTDKFTGHDSHSLVQFNSAKGAILVEVTQQKAVITFYDVTGSFSDSITIDAYSQKAY